MRAELAVVPAGYIKAVAPIGVRIAPASLLLRSILDEGVVFAAVACEHARVVLSHFSPAVASQNGFQVDAERGVELMGSKALRAGSRIGSEALCAGSRIGSEAL